MTKARKVKKRLFKTVSCFIAAATIFSVVTTLPVKDSAISASAADNITVFSQKDSSWGSYRYGYSNTAGTKVATISSSGCGLLALTNAVYSLNGKFIHPKTLADFSLKNGARVNGVGTDEARLISSFSNSQGGNYGFKYDGTTTTYEGLARHLDKGGVAVVGVYNHLIAVTDYRDGKFLILDSYASSNRGTQKGYTWKTKSELQNNWRIRFRTFYLLSEVNAPTSISLKKGSATNTVTVSWKAPIVGKGKTLSYYDVEIYRSDSTKLYKKIFNVRKTSTSLTLTLPAGNTYTAQVAAVYTDSSYYFTERSNSVTLSKVTPKQTIKNLPSGTISGFTLSNYTQTAVYSDSALKNRLYGREIWSTDCCRILQIVSDKVLKIQYPAGNTYRTVYVPATMFFNGTTVQKIAIKQNTTVYRKSSGNATIGTAWTSDTIFAVGSSVNGRQQIVYNISGGWKMGFIPTSTIR